MDDATAKRYREEFKTLGVSGVRTELLLKRWRADKQNFARQWLELKDVGAWNATHSEVPPDDAPPRSKSRLLLICTIVFGSIYACLRLLQLFTQN